MALGWMSALKLVPWGQVIEATPHIVQGARKLVRRESPAAPAAPAAPGLREMARNSDHAAALMQEQLTAAQECMARLQEDQLASAALIRSLAEQNAQLVRAVDELRQRSHWTLVAVALLSVVSLALLGWALSH